MPRIKNRSSSSAGEGSRLDLVYGFAWYGGRPHGEAYPADGDSSRGFACRAGVVPGHGQERAREGGDQDAGGFGSAEGMPFPKQQPRPALELSRRRAVEVQPLASRGKEGI